VLNQFLIFGVPFIAIAALFLIASFSESLRLNGVCRKCGENLPHRGLVRCPWCGRLCIVLRFR
jgi:hypothetical protein